MNEYDVQWVGESDWQFKVSFSTTKEELDLPSHDLIFEGLDTFCKVELVSPFDFLHPTSSLELKLTTVLSLCGSYEERTRDPPQRKHVPLASRPHLVQTPQKGWRAQ